MSAEYPLPKPFLRTNCPAWRDSSWQAGDRAIPEETAVALTYNRVTHAVMMATPQDIEDFAVGFSLTEGIVAHPDEIEELDVVPGPLGVEARMWVGADRVEALRRRQRRLAGPTGCGLCGLDSLAQAMRPPRTVGSGLALSPQQVMRAVAALGCAQPLNAATRAMHGAGFWTPRDGMVAIREDVGRHNALDKLAGALARQGVDAASGLAVMTSRVSVELVQKVSAIGASILAAVSAPTALAVRMAEQSGLTLVGVARNDGFEVFTHPGRVSGQKDGTSPGSKPDEAETAA